jgi:hypothetical protein
MQRGGWDSCWELVYGKYHASCKVVAWADAGTMLGTHFTMLKAMTRRRLRSESMQS